MKNTPSLILLICLVVLLASFTVVGQTEVRDKNVIAPDKALYDSVLTQDSLLFIAFNTRNINALKEFFSEELEVYQDNIGLRNYEETIAAFGGLFQQDYILNRKLVEGSVEVYPILGFGAIETGSHTFCHTENGKPDCGTFKFVHIWRNQDGKWKIVRLITYGH